MGILLLAACGQDGSRITEPEGVTSPLLAVGTDSVSGASIETDKDDYQPGDVVHITGLGWALGETVRLHMTEYPNTHEDVTQDVPADTSGAFSVDYYDVQEHDLEVTFTLTATGLTSGSVATATFTDHGASPVAAANYSLTADASHVVTVRVDLSGAGGANTFTAAVAKISNQTLGGTLDVNLTSPGSPGNGTWSGTFEGVCGTEYKVNNVVVTWRTTHDHSSTQTPGGTVSVTTSACPASNQAPAVDAGGPYSGAEGSAIALSGATASDPDGDALTYTWTANTTGIDGGGGCSFSPNNAVLNPSITCTDDSGAGTFTLTLEVNDGNGHVVTDNADLTVTNANPTANAGGPYNGDEGSAIQLNGSGDDPGNNDDASLTYEWSVNTTGIDGGGSCSFSPSNTAQNPTITCTDDSEAAAGGHFTVSLIVRDDDGAVSVASTANLTVTNANPTADAHGPYSGNEGSVIQLSGSADDPGNNDDASLTYEWSVNTTGIDAGGSCSFSPSNTAQNPTITCTDDSEAAAGGHFTVSLVVKDDDGGVSVASTANLTLANLPPTITAVVLTPFVDGYVYSISGQPTVNATWTDPGSNDTHTCKFEVFDYQDVEVGTDRTCGSGLGVLEAGVYTVTITVTDDDGDSDSESVQVVVYDPSAGFVTGGGWIYSAAGAYKADLSLEGKATFGFVSRYQKGATIPTGNTEFVFHAGNLNFHSSWYQWLVVNAVGTRAQYKGQGTINGGATMYPFILTAIDGKTSGPDQFRMQIFEPDGETVLYDNYVSGPATEQPLGGGSIVIHTGKK